MIPQNGQLEVGLYSTVKYKNMYPNIDIIAYAQNQNFKYDFVVAVGGDPAKINLEFNGADKLIIKNNKLIIKTSVGD